MFRFGSANDRGARQFGTLLSHQLPPSIRREKNWFKNAGIGPVLNSLSVLDEEGGVSQEWTYSHANTAKYKTFGERLEFVQDDVSFELMAAFGETDDQILIHVPSKSLLMPGGIGSV